MVEDSNYTAGSWKGHDFSDARRAYDTHVNRSYSDAAVKKVRATDLLPASVTTDSTHPLILFTDVTGSMGEWPTTIFSKLPYMEHELKTEYLGEDVQVLFGAVGDANSDKYPLQIRPFTIGTDLAEQMKQLIIEGGGGGQQCESYELAALYALRNILVPNALKPIMIMIGDEAPYARISVEMAKEAKVNLRGALTAEAVFAELKRKFAFYLIRKPYGDSRSDEDRVSQSILNEWLKLLDTEHIVTLPDPNRVVDVIFGILAKEAGRIDYFMKEIEDRQRPDQVATVYQSLKTVMSVGPGNKSGNHTGKSVMLTEDNGRVAKRLV